MLLYNIYIKTMARIPVRNTRAKRTATLNRRRWKPRNGRTTRRALAIYKTPKSHQVHFHVRRINTIKETDFSVDTATALGQYYRGLSFRLSDLQDYTELSHLYDQYVITKIVLDFQWTLTSVAGMANGPNASYSPQLNLVKDYDDDSTPNDAYFRSSGRNIRKRLTANNPFRIAITPAVSNTVYSSLGFNGYGPKWKQKIDMNDIDVPHYGAKVQILCPQTNVGFIQCTAKYYVSCYQTR